MIYTSGQLEVLVAAASLWKHTDSHFCLDGLSSDENHQLSYKLQC